MGVTVVIRFRRRGADWCAPVSVADDYEPRKILRRFFAAVERDCGPHGDLRYHDPSGLAAKFIVWMAADFTQAVGSKPLDFSGVHVSSCVDGEENWDVWCLPHPIQAYHTPTKRSRRRPLVKQA